MSSFLSATRESYDSMVDDYVEMVRPMLDHQPLDRALFGVFAQLVHGAGGGPVADVGCGPGRVTVVLAELGLDAFGIDLSPAMVATARRTHPDLRFEVGSMLALDLPDATLGGLLAYYSIIHVPWHRRPEVFAEFFRVLTPGGHLMLAFQVGDDARHLDEAYGRPVDLTFHRQRPEEVADLLRAAGFEMWMTAVREADGEHERTPQGYLIARRPIAGPS
jgi:ubiquinone/menaquinone biosynthesis C-methylase UbiE